MAHRRTASATRVTIASARDGRRGSRFPSRRRRSPAARRPSPRSSCPGRISSSGRLPSPPAPADGCTSASASVPGRRPRLRSSASMRPVLAKKFGAAVVTLEHQYYGKSSPFELLLSELLGGAESTSVLAANCYMSGHSLRDFRPTAPVSEGKRAPTTAAEEEKRKGESFEDLAASGVAVDVMWPWAIRSGNQSVRFV